jgi:hypothetical protein
MDVQAHAIVQIGIPADWLLLDRFPAEICTFKNRGFAKLRILAVLSFVSI